MSNIQFIQVTPQDLAEIITDAFLKRLDALYPIKVNQSIEAHKEILTKKETAELLNVSTKTIDNHVKAGILKKYVVGNKPYYKYSEVIQCIERSNVA